MPPSFRTLDLTRRNDYLRLRRFFRREQERLSVSPMLFDPGRWGRCEKAIVAGAATRIIGVVTLAANGPDGSGRPALDTLYVSRGWRRRGLGYELFERGLRRLVEQAGRQKVFCDLQSSLMLKLVAKLPADLRSRLTTRESFRSGDLADEL